MKDDRIQIKGNKDGVNVNIDMEKFIGFDDMLEAVIESFYSCCAGARCIFL